MIAWARHHKGLSKIAAASAIAAIAIIAAAMILQAQSTRQYGVSDVSSCFSRWAKQYATLDPGSTQAAPILGNRLGAFGGVELLSQGQDYVLTQHTIDTFSGIGKVLPVRTDVSTSTTSGHEQYDYMNVPPSPIIPDSLRATGSSLASYYPGTSSTSYSSRLTAKNFLLTRGPLPALDAIVYSGAGAKSQARNAIEQLETKADKARLISQMDAAYAPPETNLYPQDVKHTDVGSPDQFSWTYTVDTYASGAKHTASGSDLEAFARQLGGPHEFRVGNVVYASWRPIYAAAQKLLRSCKATGRSN